MRDIVLTLEKDNNDVQYVSVNQNEIIKNLDVREVVPGVRWNSLVSQWEVPLRRRSVQGLRKLLTGLGSHIEMSAETAKTLATVADQKPVVDVIVNGEVLNVNVEYHSHYAQLMTELAASVTGNGTWTLPLDKASELVNRASNEKLDLVFDTSVYDLIKDNNKPPSQYNQELVSLYDIPLSALRYVADKEGQVLRSKAKKKPTSFIQRLSDIGLNTWWDLINCSPIRYIDRSSPKTINEFVIGEEVTLVGKISAITAYDSYKKMTKISVTDVTGRVMSIAFFRQPWLNKQFRQNMEVIVYGKCETYTSPSGSIFKQIGSPKIDILQSKRGERAMIPIYPQSEKASISTWDIMAMTDELLSRLIPPLNDNIPSRLMQQYNLLPQHTAYKLLHFPSQPEDYEKARRTLGYGELLRLQLFINAQRYNTERLRGLEFNHDLAEKLVSTYVDNLPYTLTGAQSRAVTEILADVSSANPMHRLLQGDVSSGKSTIAAVTLFSGVANGYQGILMAPTEILAEQLYKSISGDVEKYDIRSPKTNKPVVVTFLGGKTTAKQKREIAQGAKDGSIDIVVGTHALLFQEEGYKNLGVVVIDEQHRFGTAQRTRLRELRDDGITPHMLVMTATPIPRTSAMVVYGDLDVTILNELPPGRVKIETTWVRENGQDIVKTNTHPVWRDVKSQVLAGHQAYVVASLVEDNEKLAAQSTEDAYQSLSSGALRGLRLGMVHGKQNRKEREQIMKDFAEGDIDVLVSTTVIEVGVNVPNATVMVVLDAGQFGISQLHQIRGRVGRATFASRCYLVTNTHTSDGISRMEALVESTDGFYLAEKDLEIRGEGTLFGSRQSGASDLKIATLQDMSMLKTATKDAQKLLADDPRLTEHSGLYQEVVKSFHHQKIDS